MILAIDPGSVAGWALFAKGELVDSGVIRKCDAAKAYELLYLWPEVKTVYMEKPFMNYKTLKDKNTFRQIANAVHWEAAATILKTEYKYVESRSWQASYSLRGDKNDKQKIKRDMQDMVERLLGFRPVQNQADAILIGWQVPV